MFEQNIFARLADWQAQGLNTGLATLVAVDGSSPRPIGAQIAIAEDGQHVGIISSRQDSALTSVFAAANCLVQRKADAPALTQGAPVQFLFL